MVKILARDFSQLKRGSLELMALFLLSQKDMYGYQICQQINKRSQDLFPVQMASLYPVLYRLIKDESISSSERVINGRKRVYYHIEKKGCEAFTEMKQEYESLTQGIAYIFASNEDV